jgi:hypothetical protein
MRGFAPIPVALFLLAAGPLFSQSPSVPASSKKSTPPTPTLKINSRLVIVDVVVTKDGKPVTGLQ